MGLRRREGSRERLHGGSRARVSANIPDEQSEVVGGFGKNDDGVGEDGDADAVVDDEDAGALDDSADPLPDPTWDQVAHFFVHIVAVVVGINAFAMALYRSDINMFVLLLVIVNTMGFYFLTHQRREIVLLRHLADRYGEMSIVIGRLDARVRQLQAATSDQLDQLDEEDGEVEDVEDVDMSSEGEDD